MRRVREPDAANPLVLTSEGMIWIGIAVLMGGIGWFKSINLVFLLAYLMGVMLVLNGVLARRQARRVEARRDSAAPVYAGEPATVRVIATNTSSRPATVTVSDRAGAEPVRWVVHRLEVGASTACSAPQVFRTRGRLTAQPIHVSSAAPFGLLAYDKPCAVSGELLVLPALGVADAEGLRRWLLRHAGGDGRARKLLHRVTTDQADVRGVRPYRPGDPIRTVHWRSSARRRQLMVREYDTTPAPDLVLVVEPWLPVNPTAADHAVVEAALSLAATVVRTWSLSFGATANLLVAGDTLSRRTASSTEESVRHALTPLAIATGGHDFGTLPPEAFTRSLLRATRLVVSSRRDSPYANELATSTGHRFLALCPAESLPWYQPPAALAPEPSA